MLPRPLSDKVLATFIYQLAHVIIAKIRLIRMMQMYSLLSHIVIGFGLLLLSGCGHPASVKANQSSTPQASIIADEPPSPTTAEPEPIKKLPQLPKSLDDAKPGSDFYRFREQLRQAIRRRDANFIRQHSVPNIKLSFGDDKATWDKYKINNPNAQVWQDLERTFSGGCYETKGGNGDAFNCPYIAAFLSKHQLDIDYVGVVGNSVPFYAKPNAKSAQIDILSQEIAKLDKESTNSLVFGDPKRWVGIILTDGRHGYVTSQYVYSHIGYRSTLVKSKDSTEWIMIWFIAGD
jgi:hypothetical protein